MTDYARLAEQLRYVAWMDDSHCSDVYEESAKAIEALIAERDALQAENERLKKDAERRGWLLGPNTDISLIVDKETKWSLVKFTDTEQAKIFTMRLLAQWK